MTRNRSAGFLGGTTKQSGTTAGMGPPRGANGLLLSGVVVNVYPQVDGGSPFPDGMVPEPSALFCDVVTYGTREGLYSHFLKGCLILGQGMHNGHVWIPRAATMDMTGEVNDPEVLDSDTFDPMNLDGDHVLIGFRDQNLSLPVVLGRLPHPKQGVGNSTLPQAGHRMRLKKADGAVDLHKHQGSFYGVDKDGNIILDTTRAHGGDYKADGTENPAEDTTHGNVVVNVQKQAKLTIRGLDKAGADEKFRVVLEDGKLTVVMGNDATKSLTLDTDNSKLSVQLGSANKSLELDGSSNKLSVKLGDTSHVLEIDQSKMEAKLGGDGLKLEQMGPSAVLSIGDGSDNAVSFTQLDAWWSTIAPLLSTHVHPTTAPGAPTLVAPALSSIATAPPPDLWKLAGLKVRSGPA